MANDPNRDLLPVKEGSCADTCRGHTIDERDRHAVVNLDRYELEDRYLRMRDEVFDLKKLSNAQEDKIKRLATKLMRASATPGSCLEEALHPDDNRQENLELENAKLKDKIAVLRNQILNTKFGGRSPSRSRRLQICSSSGPATCRSDIGRMRSSTSQLLRASDGDNEKNAKNYVAKIEELEMEKKSLTSRIEDLEIQIASHEAGHQRQKVAENVEFIRVWRQMKLQNDELLASRARNASLEEQICDLKEILEEKSRNVKDATNALLAEQKRMVDMDEQLAKAKMSQLTLSEKDERIRELTNEIKILNQHNNELIALSSKCSNAEMENIELRKKHSEQLSDNLSLKSAFSNEQTNIVALQAANQQLMAKLHELQTNVDTLTIQLKALQSQNERQARSSSDRRVLRTVDRQTSTNSSPEKKVPFPGDSIRKEKDVCTRCCQSPRQSVAEKYRPISVSREVQTDEAKLEVRRNSADRAIPKQSPVRIVPRATICDRSFQHDNGNLSAEKMIELLEKAQINTPLDAQNVSRIRRIDSAIAKSCVNASDSRQSWSPCSLNKSSESLVNDPWKILLVLYKILRENVANSSTILEDNNSYVCDNHCDENNNTRISTDTGQEEYQKNKRNASLRTEKYVERRKCDAEQKTARSFSKNCGKGVFKTSWIEDVKNHKTPTNYLVDRCTRMNDCRCEPSEECSYEVDCGQPCVPSISAGELTGIEGRSRDCQCETSRDYFKNFVDDFRSSLQETFDNIHRSRASRVSGASSGLYRSWPRVSESENSAHRSSRARGVLKDEKSEEAVIENFEQCGVIRVKEKVNNYQNEKDLRCMTCRNEICGNGPTVGEIGSSPVLVTNDQGVLEVHMLRLQLTAMATRIICRETKANYPLIFVSCDLCNEERAFRPFLKYPKLNFDSTSIYRVTNLSKFFDRVLERTFCFRIHISRRANTSCPVARAYLSIKDILDYPKNKLYYVVNFSSTLPCSRGQDFGQLPIWMRLDCDLEKIETCKKRRGIFRQSSSGKTARQTDSEEKMVCRPSRSFDGRIPSVNVKPDNTRGDTLKGLTPKTRWKSTSTQVEKENAQSSRIGDKRFFSSLQPARISRESQNPGPEQLTAVPDEKKSSTSERSLVNGKSSVITSALTWDSPTSRRVSLVKRSYSSISDEIEAEDTTSEEFRKDDRKRETRYMVKSSLEGNEKLKRDVDDGNTASVDEFNNLIRPGTILSPRKSGSSVQDLGSVFTDDNWRKYRKKSIAVTEKSMGSPISPTGTNERSINSYVHDDRLGRTYDAVVLRIESLALFRRCPFLNDPKIHQVYVEFSFLGYRGAELETISVPKPAANVKAYFNYMRKFNFDAEKHATQRNIMRDIMTGNESPTIKFVLVSEPVMEEMETKECEEVGYAHFNIRDHILRGHSKDVSLTIMNTEQTEAFGILKITLLGAEAIRRCMSDF